MNKYLILDAEIAKGIEPDNEKRSEGVRYCEGWNDFTNMGISTVCTIAEPQSRASIYMADNLQSLQTQMDDSEVIVTFNGYNFDRQLLAANGLTAHSNHYDILRVLWLSLGLDPDNYNHSTHGGYSLDKLAKANGIPGKTGNGSLAPVDFQRENLGKLVSYCLDDCWITLQLLDVIKQRHALYSPVDGSFIPMPDPEICAFYTNEQFESFNSGLWFDFNTDNNGLTVQKSKKLRFTATDSLYGCETITPDHALKLATTLVFHQEPKSLVAALARLLPDVTLSIVPKKRWPWSAARYLVKDLLLS